MICDASNDFVDEEDVVHVRPGWSVVEVSVALDESVVVQTVLSGGA